MFAWFLLGSSLVLAWFRLVSACECNKMQHVCMVPAWFHLVPQRGVLKNTPRLVGSCLVPAWFQLRSAWLLIASITKRDMFAWFRLGSAWFLIAGCTQTHQVSRDSASFQLGSSLVPLGFSSRVQQNTTCLHGSGLVLLGSSARNA